MLGDNAMSVVISICGYEFSIMMSDGRVIAFNDDEHKYEIENEHYPKIKRFSDKILIGYTGDPVPTTTILNELNYLGKKNMTLEGVKDIFINKLKTLKINSLGVQLIFSGISQDNIFKTYYVDSKKNFNAIEYNTFGGNLAFVVAFPSSKKMVEEKIRKHIFGTYPWSDLNDLKKHMKECIIDISKICNTVNENIYEEEIIN